MKLLFISNYRHLSLSPLNRTVNRYGPLLAVFMDMRMPETVDRLQLDDGYAKIVHGVFLALAQYKMSNNCTRVLMVIFRMTYGFQRKEAQISLDKFEQMTGIHKSHIVRAIKALTYHNIITRLGNYDPPKYSFQKYFTKWKPWEGERNLTSALPNRVKTITQSGNASLKININIKKTHGLNVSDTPKGLTEKQPPKPPPKPPKPTKTQGNGYFDRFWNAYPKKYKKIDAQKAWGQMIKDPAAMIDTLVAAVEAWKKTNDWQRDSGRYIPYPATWLRAGQWMDEVEKQGQTKGACSWANWRERVKNADCKGQREESEG